MTERDQRFAVAVVVAIHLIVWPPFLWVLAVSEDVIHYRRPQPEIVLGRK